MEHPFYWKNLSKVTQRGHTRGDAGSQDCCPYLSHAFLYQSNISYCAVNFLAKLMCPHPKRYDFLFTTVYICVSLYGFQATVSCLTWVLGTVLQSSTGQNSECASSRSHLSAPNDFLKKDIFIYVYVFVCTRQAAWRGQNRLLEPLDLEWQAVEPLGVGAEDATQVLWKESKTSYMLMHLSSPFLL